MEILNSFVFDIQLFATADLSGQTITVEGMSDAFNPETGRIYWHKDTGKYNLVADDADLVIKVSGKTGDYTTTSVSTDKITHVTTEKALTASETLKLPAKVGIAVSEKTENDLKLATVVENGCTLSGANAITTTTDGTVSAITGTIAVSSGTLALTDDASLYHDTNTFSTLANGAKLSTVKDGLVESKKDGSKICVDNGEITLAEGEFTTTSTAKLGVLGYKGDVFVNGNKFIGGDTNTYTYGASGSTATFVRTGAVTATSDITKVITPDGTTFTLSGVSAKFACDGNPSPTYLAYFTTGTINAADAATFVWDKTNLHNVQQATKNVTFTNFKGTLIGNEQDASGYYVVPTVTNMTAGSIQAGIEVASISVNGTTFTNGNLNNAIFRITSDGTNVGLDEGVIESTGDSYNIMKDAQVAQVVTVEPGTEVKVKVEQDTGNAIVTGLDTRGEKVTIGNTTYTVITDKIVKATIDNIVTYYNADSDGYQAGGKDGQGNDLTMAEDGPRIETSQYTENGTYTFNARAIPKEGADAATLTVSGTTKNIDVKESILAGVDMSGDTVSVVDHGTSTKYTLSATNSVTAYEASFTTTDGVVSSATGTITVFTGTVTASGTVNVDVKTFLSTRTCGTMDGAAVIYKAGEAINNASILTTAGTLCITAGAQTTDILVDSDGDMTGLGEGATLTGVPTGRAITTTGNGRITINGRSYTLSNSGSGITYISAATGISSISGLTNGAVLKLEDSFTDGSLTFVDESMTITGITSVDGVEITKRANGYTLTLDKEGEQFVDKNRTTYRLASAAGSAVISEDGSSMKLAKDAKISITASNVTTYYTAAADGTVIDYNNGTAKLTTGAITLGENERIEVEGKGILTNTGTADITVSATGAITWTATDGVSFTTTDVNGTSGDTTYTCYDGGKKLAVVAGSSSKFYEVNSSLKITMVDGPDAVKGIETTGPSITITAAHSEIGDNIKYYTTIGLETTSTAVDCAVKIEYTKSSDSYALTLNSPVIADIVLTDAKVTGVTNPTNAAAYVVSGSKFKSSANFAVDSNVITGTITATSANGAYALGSDDSKVTFIAGADGVAPNGAQITLNNGEPITLTETGNTGATGTKDTVITGTGAITGLDSSATVVAGSLTAKTASTVSNFALNATATSISTNGGKIIAFPAGNGEITFTADNIAKGLKNVSVSLSGATVVGIKGETESVSCAEYGMVEADANGDLTVRTGTYTTVEGGEIDVKNRGADVTINTIGGVNGVTFICSNNYVIGTYTGSTDAKKVKAILTSTESAGGLTAAKAGAELAIHGQTYTTASDNTTIVYGTDVAKLTAGAVILDKGESIVVDNLGTIRNDGNVTISVDAAGSIKNTLAADGKNFVGGEVFTTIDTTGKHTVKYNIKNGAEKVSASQIIDGEAKKTTCVYPADGTIAIAVQMKAEEGAFTNADVTTEQSGGELTGVIWASGKKSDIPPVAEIREVKYYDEQGIEITDAELQRDAAIVIDGTRTPKTVTIKRAVEDSLPSIDLTDTETNVTDTTGTAVFNINDSSISGRAFSVKGNVVTETGSLLTVTEGSIKTSDSDGKFSVVSGCTITTTGNSALTINGEKITLIGSDNGVTYTADTTKPNMISAISGLDAGEAITFESYFTGGAVNVDGTAVTAITSKNGITFMKQGSTIKVELDQNGESVTVGGFAYTLEKVSNGGITIYTDTKGSHVAGLTNGEKVTVVYNNSTTTYEVSDGDLVIGYSGKTKSYTLGDENSFATTWDGTNAPTSTGEAGTSLKEGTVTVENTELDSVVDGTQIDAQGNVTTDKNKAVATIETTDDSLTYKANDKSGNQELSISDTNGMDWNIDMQDSKGNTHVDAGVTRDEAGNITGTNPVNNAVNVETGSGKSEVTVYSNSDSKIQGGSGNLNATVGGKGDHHVTAGAGSKNELKDFGTGENVLMGGSGKNTFESSNENGKLVAGSGKNTFKTTKNVTNKVEGFTYGKDVASIGSAITDTSKFIVGEGTISYEGKASNGELDVSSGTGTGSIFAVTILDSTGKKTNVGWTGEEGGTIDASSETSPLVLIGDQNGDAKDILMGGKGKDVIYAGEGDSVTGGEGNNEIHLDGSGIAVGFGKTGAKDEVTGFKAGFDESEADNILLMDSFAAEELNLAFDGKDAVLKSGGTSMKLDSIQKNTSTNAAELLVGGAKVAAIEQGTTAKITEVDYADVYFGTGSAGVNFEAVSDDITIDLSDKSRFRNIESVTGGTGNTLLMGGGSKVTLVSGGGNTSLWGGTGNAMLVGAKDSRDEFFFFGESGKDTVSGFTSGTGDTSDVLNLNGSPITDIRGTKDGVEISTTHDSKVLLQGLKANEKLQWTSGEAHGVAKVGSRSEANSFTYEADVTNYFGGNKSDTLSVSGESNSVWLDGVGSSIEVIDASSSTGNNLIAGSSESQTIKGGRGNNTLWGGAGGNDILTGGSGHNEFYFGMGEGNDIITQSNDGDKIMLYNVKVSDLNAQATGMKDGNMVIALKDGSSLTIQNYDRQGATTFQLSDGTYSYDKSTGTWS